MVEFGVWSTLLLIGSLHGLVVALLLFRAPRNRAANRFLGALLIGVVLMITPYTIGYAGFYDAYPWLSFAPFYWQLAFGPLLYLHVHGLGAGTAPRRWALHLIPGAAQGAYYFVAFCLPLQSKWDWNERAHEPYIAPTLHAATLLSLSLYGLMAWRRYRRYQGWLEANSAQREDLHLGWVRGFLIAIAAVAALYAGYRIVGAVVTPLNYFDYFPVYIVLSLLVYYLGIEGLRHADLRLPIMHGPETASDMAHAPDPYAPDPHLPDARAASDLHTSPSTESADLDGTTAAVIEEDMRSDGAISANERDWRALGETWSARVADAGWWREPELSLADLARRLGTNTQYLSRALNDGLGVNFSQFVNALRVAEAQRRLRGGGGASDPPAEITTLALEVGFGSKASFNRAFRAHTGLTPSAYRDACAGDPGRESVGDPAGESAGDPAPPRLNS